MRTPEKPDRIPYDSVPDCLKELANQARWVGWRWELRNREWTKPPRTPAGQFAKNSDPETWSTLKAIEACVESGKFDGVGLMLLDLKCFAAIDLDNCRDPLTGEAAQWAMDLINKGKSYTELTPTGTGYRILGHVGKEYRSIHRKLKAEDGGS